MCPNSYCCEGHIFTPEGESTPPLVTPFVCCEHNGIPANGAADRSDDDSDALSIDEGNESDAAEAKPKRKYVRKQAAKRASKPATKARASKPARARSKAAVKAKENPGDESDEFQE